MARTFMLFTWDLKVANVGESIFSAVLEQKNICTPQIHMAISSTPLCKSLVDAFAYLWKRVSVWFGSHTLFLFLRSVAPSKQTMCLAHSMNLITVSQGN